MVLSTKIASSFGKVTNRQCGPVVTFIAVSAVVFCEILVVAGGSGRHLSTQDTANRDGLPVLRYPYSVINPTASWTSEKDVNNASGKILQEVKFQGKSRSNSSTGGHTNNISDYIKNGELSDIFCERCTESQKSKVEQILYLLYNFNNNAGSPAVAGNSDVKLAIEEIPEPDKNYVLFKKKKRKFFRATSSPVPVYRKNLPEMIPTPETVGSSYHHQQLSRVIQLPSTLSTTTPATSSPGYSSMAIPIVPFFYSSSPTSPLPSSSTTVSSAMEPVQSVEMPTPPMPPTTTGPIYLYYLGGATSSASSLSSSGSLEPPTTPVVESSVAYASKPTTMEPML